MILDLLQNFLSENLILGSLQNFLSENVKNKQIKKKDMSILLLIQSYFGDVDRIKIDKNKNKIKIKKAYVVTRISDLNFVIIYHFYKYPLSDHK